MSLLQAQAAPLKMDSSSPSKHTDLQEWIHLKSKDKTHPI